MHKFFILLITIIFLLTGCSCADSEVLLEEGTVNGQEDAAFLASDEDLQDHTEKEPDSPGTIYVYVCGEVLSPGVYELTAGSRVVDAVSAAGGILDSADDTYVNLAAPLEDGIKLRIPPKEEISEKSKDQKAVATPDEGVLMSKAITEDIEKSGDGNGLLNINTASAAELTSLPGIGESIAGKITKYRDENGRFSCIEDIMKINGIKDKLFQKIKDRITV